MKLYNLKNLVVVSINDKKLICHRKEEELSLSEALTGCLICLEGHSEIIPLQKKYCFNNARPLCVLDKEQIIKYYLKLNHLTEESTSELMLLIEQSLRKYYQECETSLSLEEKTNIKNELEKTCANCANATCRVPNVEKSLDSSDDCLAWHNPTLVEKEMVRKRVKTKYNTPNATKI